VLLIFLYQPRPPPRSPLFPYTTLFRSQRPRLVLGILLVAGSASAAEPAHQRIDAMIAAGAKGQKASLPADDAEFLRRITLDLARSEEHTSELQSQSNLVCRLLLEKKKI